MTGAMDHRPLQELRLRDFRCFRGEQTARVAPLTLLVGDNSTGKTSFLAAVRTILEVAGYHGDPDFRSAPYDLGSFQEIAHHQRDDHRAGAGSFSIGVSCTGIELESFAFDATFTLGKGAAPALATVKWSAQDMWITEQRCGPDPRTELGCSNGSWRLPDSARGRNNNLIYGGAVGLADVLRTAAERGVAGELEPLQGDATPTIEDFQDFGRLYREGALPRAAAFAGAPIRSSPLRTYDPRQIVRDPEGSSVPAFLADAQASNSEQWKELKRRMEEFGRGSGLFEEITVKRLGTHEFQPFQVEVRMGTKGARRNLLDVGYGVSQVLPLLLELLIEDGYLLFLLQQPEVHLHPSAQAALGSLFCAGAASGRQLIVETHSDYILDRILLDVRDRRTELRPDDVSILYFEREGLDVTIHSIHVDAEGNVLDPPDGYRSFFKRELHRVIDY